MKKTHIISIIVIAIAIGAIISTVSNAATYTDFTMAKQFPGKEFQVVGQLNKERRLSIHQKKTPTSFLFPCMIMLVMNNW